MQANEALEKLKEGNLRYVQASADDNQVQVSAKPHKVILEQKPFAVVLGCSDSRAPAELLFDQGVGDLFIIRVAGNIAEPSQIGSIEFACEKFGTQLVVVMGHSLCGAVAATVDTLSSSAGEMSPNLASIVDRVAPAILPVVAADQASPRDELISKAMRANVEYSVKQLESRSAVLRNLVEKGKLKIVGAEYSIETGVVEFYL